jgi:hypothetical protein
VKYVQPLPIPIAAWQDIFTDFIEGLPQSEHYNAIMVVVDRLTKYAHFIPVNHPYTAQTIAKLFLDTVVKLHGLSKQLCLTEIQSSSVNFGKSYSSFMQSNSHCPLLS